MEASEHEYLYKLQGRILACEEIQRRLLNVLAVTSNPNDPESFIDLFEKRTMASLQQVDREIGDEADLIWENMAVHLRDRFEQARAVARGE